MKLPTAHEIETRLDNDATDEGERAALRYFLRTFYPLLTQAQKEAALREMSRLAGMWVTE